MKQIIFFLAIVLSITACNQNKTKDKFETTINIESNNGEKWKVNDEMKPFIEEGKKILSEFISLNKVEYKTLATKLKEQNDRLIKGCTMKGKAHEELHNWLLPHIHLITELENSNDEEESKMIVGKLNDSFKVYDDYFE